MRTDKKIGRSYVIDSPLMILRAVKNTINRSKRPWESKNGSVSTTRHHIRCGMELTSLTGQIETWHLNHFDKNGWTGPGLQELYDKMIDIRESYSPEEMSDKEIMKAVLGRDSVHLRGWGDLVEKLTKEHVVLLPSLINRVIKS
ncbi:hypothetical protein AgCh_035522 [Apium graveolens]